MFKAYKYRLYPTTPQKVLIEKHFGCCRYVFNWGLEQKINYYHENNKQLHSIELSAKLTQMKKEIEWLCEVNAQSLQQALRNLDAAYTKFFKEHIGFPQFKSRKNLYQTFSIPQRYKVDFIKNTVLLPKIGAIKTKLHRLFEGTTKTATVSRAPTGKYFISILVDDGKEEPKKQLYTEDNIIGVDVGIKQFAVLSTGEKVENPKYLYNSMKRLEALHKRVHNKTKGSNNRRKAKQKLSLLYEKVKNQRNDFQHKLSAKLISENQAIAVEDLNVSGLMKNHNLAKAISDAAWSNFLFKLEYKALWQGKTVLKIGRFEPSSKRCNACGFHNANLTLNDRYWTCPACNTIHDRDVNAAINIKKMAVGLISPMDYRVEPVDLFAMAKGVKQEVVLLGTL
jgi:putative transposase